MLIKEYLELFKDFENLGKEEPEIPEVDYFPHGGSRFLEDTSLIIKEFLLDKMIRG